MKFKKTDLFLYFLLLISTILFCLDKWFLINFGEMNFDQILFTITSNLEGTDTKIVFDFLKFSVPYIFAYNIIFVLYYYASTFILKKNWFNAVTKKNNRKCINLIQLAVSLFFLLRVLFSISETYNIYDYIKNRSMNSLVYEESYIDPKGINISFPNKKRNLIYIYLESMEYNYSDYEINGQKHNLIPELSRLANENYNFSHSSEIGGARQVNTVGYTVSALVGHTAGVGLNIPISGNEYGNSGKFLPGVTTLGTILENNGYKNYFLMGSDARFANRDVYFKNHGNYKILDYKYAVENNWIDEDYHVFWGYEDKKLFQFAQKILLDISKKDEPFNLSMLTVDTHFMDGYVDKDNDLKYDNLYANAISGSDKKIGEFINWLSKQDFYQNTTIIISGDHLTMNREFAEQFDDRRIYNVIINPPFEIKKSFLKNRDFTVFDFFPTTLELLNVKVKGHRLGLGTSLISNKKTLLEEYGEEYFSELNMRSEYYNQYLLNER